MKNEISEIDFDVAIIGAGAYGLPLASYIKEMGRQAIHMGGSTQMVDVGKFFLTSKRLLIKIGSSQ